jgi:hypothetical protein
MNRIEYDLLLKDSPELELPHWFWLTPGETDLIAVLTREEFIARRSYMIMAATHCPGFLWIKQPIIPID